MWMEKGNFTERLENPTGKGKNAFEHYLLRSSLSQSAKVQRWVKYQRPQGISTPAHLHRLVDIMQLVHNREKSRRVGRNH